MAHVRNYTFSELVGGTKGEKFDFLLQKKTDGSLRYIPVSSKVKLNKKRKANAETNEDGDQKPMESKQAQHIVLAPRSFSGEDQKQIQTQIADSAMSLKLNGNAVIFETKDQLIEVEKQVASSLKLAFRAVDRPSLPAPTEQKPENSGWDIDEDELFEMSQPREFQAAEEANVEKEEMMSDDEIF